MSLRSPLLCGIGWLAAAWILAACSSSPPPDKAATPAVHVEIAFSCLWWSEAQMEGLNPNAPPPKNTVVTLAKWEYSDPVGVPHPDTIDVVVTLANGGNQAISNLEVEVAGEWKEGPLTDAASAAWSRSVVIQALRGVSVGPVGRQVLRVPVDLKAMMDSLAQQRKWPYSLRTTVTVRGSAGARQLAQAAAEFPIKRGD